MLLLLSCLLLLVHNSSNFWQTSACWFPPLWQRQQDAGTGVVGGVLTFTIVVAVPVGSCNSCCGSVSLLLETTCWQMSACCCSLYLQPLQAEAESRERHWQSEVQGLQSKVEKLEGLLQREMGHHQLNSPTPRLVHDVSPAGVASGCNSLPFLLLLPWFSLGKSK